MVACVATLINTAAVEVQAMVEAEAVQEARTAEVAWTKIPIAVVVTLLVLLVGPGAPGPWA